MAASHRHTFSLKSMSELELHHVKAEPVNYRGRQAIRFVEHGEPMEAIAILSGPDFKDGVLETEIAGLPRKDAPQDLRGFVGIAFRVDKTDHASSVST